LSIVALLIGTVGGLGLTGTMSINVLERTREIGVMRAIGASNGAVRRIVMFEGLLIGELAWLLGILMSLPISSALSFQIGNALLNVPLTYTYAYSGALLWLAIVTFLAAVASFAPAQRAVRLTVREVLAYE
jgi:putative ABC transport system permease protein